MKRILASEKGMALMVVTMAVAIMLALLIMVTTRYFQMVLNQVFLQRNRVYASQMLQDFALLAQKANDVYVRNSNSCPGAPFDQLPPPAGRFCWDTSQAQANCIRDPRGEALPPICFDFGVFKKMNVATFKIEDQPSRLDRLKRTATFIYENRDVLMSQIWSDVVAQLNSTAHAQEIYLPDAADLAAAGAPPTLDTITCTDATAGSTFCKHCNDMPTPADRNLSCIEMQICLRDADVGGCTDIDQWYRQSVGIITR